MACIFISETLCAVEEIASVSVLDEVDWAKSIVLDKAAVISIWLI